MKKPEEIKKALACHASDYGYNGCHICPYFDGEECESGLSLDAHNYIEQLEAQIPKWISVKDRLPEESDGTVLVCFADVSPYNLKEHVQNAKHDQRVRTAKYSQYSKTWYIGDMCGVGGEDPTHWMPTLEPPNA